MRESSISNLGIELKVKLYHFAVNVFLFYMNSLSWSSLSSDSKMALLFIFPTRSCKYLSKKQMIFCLLLKLRLTQLREDSILRLHVEFTARLHLFAVAVFLFFHFLESYCNDLTSPRRLTICFHFLVEVWSDNFFLVHFALTPSRAHFTPHLTFFR